MAKYFVIVDKIMGEQTSVEGSGLYAVSNDIDLDTHPVHNSCFLVELTQEEAGAMQECGFEVTREGRVLFIDTISDLLEGEMPIAVQRHRIDTAKSARNIKDREREEYTVNLHGISYKEMRPVKVVTRKQI